MRVSSHRMPDTVAHISVLRKLAHAFGLEIQSPRRGAEKG